MMTKRKLKSRIAVVTERLLVGTGVIVAVLGFSVPNWADDVYNFYFQKAPGPTTVIQQGSPNKAVTPDEIPPGTVIQSGNNQAVVQPTPPPAAAPTQTSTAAAPAQSAPSKDYKNWEVGIGLATVNDRTASHDFRGYGLVAQYNFNKFFGLQAGVTYDDFRNDSNLGTEGRYYYNGPEGKDLRYAKARDDWSSSLNWNAGLVVTPLHIRLFNFDLIELGMSAGALSQRDANEPYLHPVSFYFGPRVAVNLVDSLSVVVNARIIPKEERGRGNERSWGNASTTATLAWRF